MLESSLATGSSPLDVASQLDDPERLLSLAAQSSYHLGTEPHTDDGTTMDDWKAALDEENF